MDLAMNHVTNIIRGVNMCALCLREISEDVVSIHDEIVLENSQIKTISELIAFVMGYEKENEISVLLSFVCVDCTKSAIKCYTFMTRCRRSHSQAQNILDNISLIDLDSFGNTRLAKTMYININKKNDIKIILDKKMGAKTPNKALKRYESLIRKINTVKFKKKTRHSYETADYFDHDAGFQKLPHVFKQTHNNIYKCAECHKVFKRSNNLRSHHDRVHAPKEFQCTECPKKFGSEYLRKLHRAESHMIAMCTDCGKIYYNIYSWKMHIASHQAKICPTCGKHYKNKIFYQRHINLKTCHHPKSMPKQDHACRYECDTCKKRFTHKGSLRVHIKFEHENGKAHVCSWCNKKLSAESKLKAHIVKHTRERNFTCEICGGKFVTKEALLYHTRIHTGEKPYPCPECDQRFISASRRMEHLRRKHWAPKLECNICSSRFKTAYCLKKHRERHFDPNSRLFAEKSVTKVNV